MRSNIDTEAELQAARDRQKVVISTKTQKVIKGLLDQDQKQVQYCLLTVL